MQLISKSKLKKLFGKDIYCADILVGNKYAMVNSRFVAQDSYNSLDCITRERCTTGMSFVASPLGVTFVDCRGFEFDIYFYYNGEVSYYLLPKRFDSLYKSGTVVIDPYVNVAATYIREEDKSGQFLYFICSVKPYNLSLEDLAFNVMRHDNNNTIINMEALDEKAS